MGRLDSKIDENLPDSNRMMCHSQKQSTLIYTFKNIASAMNHHLIFNSLENIHLQTVF